MYYNIADGNVLCKTDLPTESNPVVTCRHSSHCKLQSFFEESQRTNPNQWATEVQCDENCTTGEHLVSILVLLTNCCSIANINYTKCTWQISSTNELELYGQKPPDPNKVDLPTETLTSTESIILLPTSYSSPNSTVLTSATVLPSSPTDSRPTDNDDKPFYEIPPCTFICFHYFKLYEFF